MKQTFTFHAVPDSQTKLLDPTTETVELIDNFLRKWYNWRVSSHDEALAMNIPLEWDVDFTLSRKAITYISMSFDNGNGKYCVNIYHGGSHQDSTYFEKREDAANWYTALTKWWKGGDDL